jgi:hypothetical protein
MKVLQEASDIVNRKWTSTHGPVKILVLVGGIILLVVALGISLVWATGKALRSISPKRGTNFYFPQRRDRSMYFPQSRRRR